MQLPLGHAVVHQRFGEGDPVWILAADPAPPALWASAEAAHSARPSSCSRNTSGESTSTPSGPGGVQVLLGRRIDLPKRARGLEIWGVGVLRVDINSMIVHH